MFQQRWYAMYYILIYIYITLYVFIFLICLCSRSWSLFSYMDRPGTCIILDKKYNIANSSCHFGSYGNIWTGPSPKKYYMDLRRFGPYNIFLVTYRSIYCHMTLSAMNYFLYICVCVCAQIYAYYSGKTWNWLYLNIQFFAIVNMYSSQKHVPLTYLKWLCSKVERCQC